VWQSGLLDPPTLSLDVQLINMILKKLLNVGAKRPPIFLRKLFKLGLKGRPNPQIHVRAGLKNPNRTISGVSA
jgi:hypothetical protein